jgi:hypothetical protein
MSDDTERSVASAGSQAVAIMSWEQSDQILQDQRAEIERLRANLRLADAGFMWGPPTLTDEEREAMEAAASWLDASDDPDANRRADAIYGFLNRAK